MSYVDLHARDIPIFKLVAQALASLRLQLLDHCRAQLKDIIAIPNKGRITGRNNSRQIISHPGLKITLSRNLPQRAEFSMLSKGSILNECSLTDDAFLPKTYSLGLERGNFKESCYIGHISPGRPRFALRLLFDNSPYPPRSEWRTPGGGLDDDRLWNHIEFVSRPSPDRAEHQRPMNDASAVGWSG